MHCTRCTALTVLHCHSTTLHCTALHCHSTTLHHHSMALLCTAHCTMHTPHPTIHNVRCMLHSAHCTVTALHCTALYHHNTALHYSTIQYTALALALPHYTLHTAHRPIFCLQAGDGCALPVLQSITGCNYCQLHRPGHPDVRGDAGRCITVVLLSLYLQPAIFSSAVLGGLPLGQPLYSTVQYSAL